MADVNRIPWTRLSAEVIAIVGSILLAFAIDAWWESAVESDRERDLLIALLDDFQKTRMVLAESLVTHEDLQNKTYRLLEAAVSADPALSEADIDRLIFDLSSYDVRTRFTTGALSSAIYSGELPIIDDQVLRKLLAEWPAHIEYVLAIQSQDHDFFFSVWLPFFRQHGNLLQIDALDWSNVEVPAWMTDASISHSQAIRHPNFKNVLMQKVWVEYDMLTAYSEAIEWADQTIEQLNVALESE